MFFPRHIPFLGHSNSLVVCSICAPCSARGPLWPWASRRGLGFGPVDETCGPTIAHAKFGVHVNPLLRLCRLQDKASGLAPSYTHAPEVVTCVVYSPRPCMSLLMCVWTSSHGPIWALGHGFRSSPSASWMILKAHCFKDPYGYPYLIGSGIHFIWPRLF